MRLLQRLRAGLPGARGHVGLLDVVLGVLIRERAGRQNHRAVRLLLRQEEDATLTVC
jgi:hypothetical protein